MRHIVKYSVRGFIGTCIALGAIATGATAEVLCTPEAVLSAVALGAADKQELSCNGNVIADGGFESPEAVSPWNAFSKLYGSPICDPTCATQGAKDAFSGDGFVLFSNHPTITESAFVEQTVIVPVVDFAFGRFYLKGSADGAPLDFTVSVDGLPLLTFTIEFTSAYTEYIPLAYDLSDFLDGEPHVIRFSAEMQPGVSTLVYLDEVCVEAFDFGTEGEGCSAECAEDGTDTDRDGASDACEACRGTSPASPDSDGDGMDDRYEPALGLNPLNPTDALLDPDGDGLTTFEEFAQDANPFDRDDPNTVRFVSPNGTDTAGGGAIDAPWQSIQYALDNTAASPTRRATITLLPGDYFESVTLKPHAGLRARVPLAATIHGDILGAEDASLDALRLVAPSADDIMLFIDNIGMVVRGCFFDGTPFGGGIGARVEGSESSRTQFIGCDFSGLKIGIDVYGSVPGLRTSRIANWSEAGFWVHELDDKALKNGGIGDTTNAEVGFNQFVEGNNGPAVRYERAQTLVCELNYWGTADPDLVPNVIEGNADFVPFLASAAILPASIFCTVLNAADKSRVTDARVFASPSFLNPVTVNTNGVYSFGAVNDGQYTIRAVSDTLGESSATLNVGAGEIGSAVLILGEGDDPNPNPGCACNNAKNAPPSAADLLVAASALLTMLIAARAMRPMD